MRLPFKSAPYWVLAIFLSTFFAFFPGYFSKLVDAPLGHHLHALTASLWMILLIVQPWAIHRKKWALHRTLGLATFVLVPFFIASGLMVTHMGAASLSSGQDPFYNLFGTRLTLIDELNAVFFGGLVMLALANRRSPALHGGYMLSTLVLLMGPILSRIFPAFVPGMTIRSLEDLYRFEYALYLSLALTMLGVVILAIRMRGQAMPWLLSIGYLTILLLIMAFVPESGPVERAIASLATVPQGAVFVLGLLIGALFCWMGWQMGSSRQGVAKPA